MTALPLKIDLLGPFQVWMGSESVNFSTDAARVLLAYLASQQGVPQRRDSLAGLLSPDRPNKEALTYLRNRLTRLRKSIGDQQAEPAWLVIERKQIALRDGDDIQVDSVVFDRLIGAVETHPHRTLSGCASCLARLEEAVALLLGDFLAGLNFASDVWEAWLLAQREHYQQQALATLALLREARVERGEWEQALTIAQREIGLEPWQEAAHRAAMLAYQQLGDRSAALAQFERCQSSLWDELGVEPEDETLALGEAIARGSEPLVADTVRAEIPNNLPLGDGIFFGRKTTLTTLQDLLTSRNTQLVTLVGEGGVGKTRLALEAGQRVLDSFADGVWFVQLASLSHNASEEQIIDAIVSVLQLPLQQGQDAFSQLARYLRDKTLLLILDNCEHVLESAEILLKLLQRARNSAILLTSREPLNVGIETVLALQGLPLNDAELAPALAFFANQAKRVSSQFTWTPTTQAAAEKLVDMVAGNPLALKLAATWTRSLSIEQIVAAVEKSADFLATRQRDMPRRHRSMRAVFLQSWSLLEPQEQAVLARLSAFRGQFSAEAAQAIAQAHFFDLDTLVEKTLLQHVNGRYLIHQLLRSFVAEQLTEDGALRNRFIDYYFDILAAQSTELNGPQPQMAASIIKRDEANIQHAWGWGLAAPGFVINPECVTGLGDYYCLRGRFEEGQRLFASSLNQLNGDGAAALAQPDLIPQLLIQQARCLILLSQFADGQAAAEKGLALTTTPAIKGQAHVLLAQAAQSVGKFQLADQQAIKGLSLVEKGSRDEALVLRIIGRTALMDDRLSEAQSRLTTALTLYKKLNDLGGKAFALNNLGHTYYLKQDFSTAKRNYELAYDHFNQIGDQLVASAILANLGNVAERIGDLVGARVQFKKSLALLVHFGSRQQEAYRRDNLGNIAYLLGQIQEAHEQMALALTIYRDIGDTRGEAFCLMKRVYIWLRQNQPAQAKLDIETASRLLGGQENRSILADIAHTWGDVNLAQGELDIAQARFQEAYGLRTETGERSLQLESLAKLAQIQHQLQAHERSANNLIKIDSYLTNGGALEGVWEPLTLLTNCTILANDIGLTPIAERFLSRAKNQFLSLTAKLSEAEKQRFMANMPHAVFFD